MIRLMGVAFLGFTVGATVPVAVASDVVRGEVGLYGGSWLGESRASPTVGVAGGIRVGGALSVQASVEGLPDVSRETRQFITQNVLLPNEQYRSEQWASDVVVRFAPILLDVVGWNGRIHVGVGVGWVRTHDQLDALLAEDDPEYIAVARQSHPTASWTVGLDGPLTRHLALSAGVVRRHYVETIGVGTHVRNPLSLTVALMWRPYREKRPLHD